MLSLLALGWPAVATAQAAASRAGSFELAIGGVWTSPASLGQDDATETTNQSGGPPFTLFEASSEIDAGLGMEARLGYYLTPRIAIEGGGMVVWQQVSTHVTSDVEGLPDVTAVEDLTEFVVDGAVAIHFNPLGGLAPFVRAGAGYLRQLHEGASLVDEGVVYHAGAGATWWLSSPRRGFFKRWGLRGDARVVIRDGGFTLEDDDDVRIGAVAAGALLIAF
ncbi:MAG TPA: outer membrane beta-barrel protein [Vicinamibacterales bacterium]|nr:outer membrane beta-barrel protein [Vicinamibacterales bacterium]